MHEVGVPSPVSSRDGDPDAREVARGGESTSVDPSLESLGPCEFIATSLRVWPLELGLRRASVGVQPHEEFHGSHQPLRVTDVGLERIDTRRCGRGYPFDERARASRSEYCRIRLATSWSKEARSKAQRPKAWPWT